MPGQFRRTDADAGQAHDLTCAESLLEGVDPEACLAKAYDAIR